MKTETTTTEETTEDSPIETAAGLEGTADTVDQDSVLDQEGEEVEEELPEARRYRDLNPTSSGVEALTKVKTARYLALVTFTALCLVCLVILGKFIIGEVAFEAYSSCSVITNRCYDLKIPIGYPGGGEAYIANENPPYTFYDNVAPQK